MHQLTFLKPPRSFGYQSPTPISRQEKYCTQFLASSSTAKRCLVSESELSSNVWLLKLSQDSENVPLETLACLKSVSLFCQSFQAKNFLNLKIPIYLKMLTCCLKLFIYYKHFTYIKNVLYIKSVIYNEFEILLTSKRLWLVNTRQPVTSDPIIRHSSLAPWCS